MNLLKRVFFLIIIPTFLLASCISGDGNNADIEYARQLLARGENAFNHDSIPTAISRLTEAKEIGERFGFKDISFEANVYMALLYDMIGMQDSAYSILKHLPYIETKDRKTFGSLYYLRLLAYFKGEVDHNYSEALELNDKASELVRRVYPDLQSLPLIEMANRCELLIMANRTDEAKSIIDSLEQLPFEGNQLHLAQAYFCHGMLCKNGGAIDSAYHFFMKSQRLADEYKGLSLVGNSLRNIISIDSLRCDFDAYLVNKKKLEKLESALTGSQTGYQMAVIQEQYNNDMLHKEVEHRQSIILFTVVILILIVLALTLTIWLLRRNNATRQELAMREQLRLQAEREREQLEKELLELRMLQQKEELQQANMDNLAMSVQLASVADDKDGKDHLLPLEQQLRSLHSDFFKELYQQYPHLTRNDIRLIGYIKLGMTPPEIVQILNITQESLHKYRYRLRKKLNLGSKQNLDEFIATFGGF